MLARGRSRLIQLLRWSEKYTKTDMTYLVSGGSWLVGEQAAAALIALGVATVFGHFASQDTYGNYKYALSILSILTAFSLTGLGTAIVRSTARGYDGSLRQGFRLNLRWSWLMLAIGIGTSIYYAIQGNEFLAVAVALITAALPFLNGFGLFDSFLVGKQDFASMGRFMVLINIVPAVLVVGTLLLIGKRAIFLIIAYLVGSLLANAYAYYQSLNVRSNNEEDPELMNYGFHLSAMGVIATIADKFDSMIVFTMLGPASLAIYTYAIAIPEVLKGTVKSIVPLAMPRFANRDLLDIKNTIWTRVVWFFLLLLGVAIAYVVLVPTVFHALFPLYTQSVRFSQIYIFSIVLTAFISPFMAVLQAHKQTGALYISTNIGSISLIILLGVLVPQYGIWGAILSQFIYRIISTVVTVAQFYLSSDQLLT